MILESWVIELLDDIKEASEAGKNYDLHLESPLVDEIAEAYRHTARIEIYWMFHVKHRKWVKMQKPYLITDDYIELVHKAYLFAELCEYDVVVAEGIFEFYNSPNCRSFSFEVEPASYKGNGLSTIFDAYLNK